MNYQNYNCQDWYHFVSMNDSKLLKLCQINRVLGSGSGGQSRNKTSNKVQLKFFHLQAAYSATRSLDINTKLALRSLRLKISLDTTPSYKFRPNLENHPLIQANSQILLLPKYNNNNYPIFCGWLLDSFIYNTGDWKKLAQTAGFSNSKLSSWFADKDNVLVKKTLLKIKFIPN